MSSSVNSETCVDSNFETAANIRSLSDVGGTEPEGDSVRGGVEREAGIEIGVEGWSGADAGAFNASA